MSPGTVPMPTRLGAPCKGIHRAPLWGTEPHRMCEEGMNATPLCNELPARGVAALAKPYCSICNCPEGAVSRLPRPHARCLSVTEGDGADLSPFPTRC